MRTRTVAFLAVVMLAALVALPAAAQDGKLKVKVTPKEAYVFIDGKAMGDGSHSYRLSPGQHQVSVHNYGYRAKTETVDITAGQTTRLEVALDAVPGSFSGPWGRIQIEAAPRTAVLVNGKNPDYLVGHGDESNHDLIWKQELIVPPGTHEVTLVRDGSEVWSGDVTVAANQRVIVNAGKGTQRTTDWPRSGKLSNLPRFKAGIASATVAVLPVTIDSFTATPATIKCEDPSRLAWQTSEAVDVWLDNNKVANNGEQVVSPHATQTYNLKAAGPGGRPGSSTTVTVDPTIGASLAVSPGEIRYRRIYDKVLVHGTATLTWSTDHANSISITPFGAVSASGTRSVQPAPERALREFQQGGSKETVVVNESVDYTLSATNVCGGSATRTAALRISGTIEPLPVVVLQTVFFPTDYPDKRNPELGLLASQKQRLSLLAQGFKKYLEYDPNAKLSLEAHADGRSSSKHNMELGERRAAIVKQYLVDQGLSDSNIETVSYGSEQPLDQAAVKELEAANPAQPPKARPRGGKGDWLAYGRRVDIVMRPTNQQSLRYFPHDAGDSGVIWQVPKPGKKAVEGNE